MFHGFNLSGRDCYILCIDDGIGCRMRQTRRSKMSWLLVVSAIVAIGLFIYLVVALINPEDFS